MVLDPAEDSRHVMEVIAHHSWNAHIVRLRFQVSHEHLNGRVIGCCLLSRDVVDPRSDGERSKRTKVVRRTNRSQEPQLNLAVPEIVRPVQVRRTCHDGV